MRFIYLFLLVPVALLAQPTRPTDSRAALAKGWQELTISDGLSQGMIFNLKQDRKGFIWVATKDGLNRYDGHNFTVFTHDPYNEFSISDNYCSALLLDSRGRLWVGTLNKGLNLFDDRTQRFYHVDINDRSAPNAGNYEVRLLTEDPEGNIWVTTDNNKLFKISLPATLRTGFPDQPNFTGQVQFKLLTLPESRADGFSYRPDGQARLGTAHGMYLFNWRRPETVVKLTLPGEKPGEFYASYSDAKQDFWAAAAGNNIYCWLRGQQKIIALPPKNNPGVNIRAIDSTTLAIATMDYLWLMSPAELVRQDSLTARNAFVPLPANVYATTNLLKDQTGNLWVGTSGYGLRRFNPRIKQFHSYLPGVSLFYLFADRQGRLYARHELAYERIDRTTNQGVPFLSNSLPAADKRQRYLMQDRRGVFWISNVNFETHAQHLFKFSTDWQLVKKYPLPPNTSFGFSGNQTLEDRAGYLWIGAANGKLLRFNPATEAFQVFSYESLLLQSGAEIETYALHQDQAGTLWIGTQKGLVRASHLETGPAFSIYKNIKTDRRSLSNDFVSSIVDDPYEPARYLWVGTKGGGLERLNKQTGQFDHFTEAQGLPNKVVYGILADEVKNLWLSTNRGLAQFNPRTFAFRNYTKADGLQDDEFNTGSFVKTPSGELVFGGVNGLTAFRASEVVRETGSKPQVNVIGLKVNNEAVLVGSPDGILSGSIEHTTTLDLSHTQNLLTLEFGLMDYTNSAKNRYRYRMEGIDQDWVEAGTNRFANYAQLPSGNYTFQMTGSPDGENWSRPVELQIRIHPPFYRTWWAYLLYAIALAGIGWQLYRSQTQRLLLQQQVAFEQQEASRLADLDALKTQFFTNISHEFRTPLTLILGPVTDLKRRFPAEPVLALMERNGNRLLSLINQLLDLSKLEAGQLQPEPEPGDIAAFFRTLASSFTSLAESRQIQFSFDQNETERWADFDRDKTEKIVTNLLSNAFKFTPVGNQVRMRAQYPDLGKPGLLTLTVADTGIGIAPENLAHIFERFYQVDGKVNRPYEGTGIGLSLVYELVRVLHGTIGATSTEGMGTTFTVTLPLVDTLRGGRPVALEVFEPEVSATVKSPVPVELPAADSRQENVLLIVDDNADIRAYVRSIFEADYQIIEAEDGQDGLAKATVTLPNLVICDLMMPRLDGFGFCKALKSQEATSHIPVVMLTARATVEDRIEGFELGADDYLTKPFNRAEIQARVRNLVQQRQRLYRHVATGEPTPTAKSAEPPLQPTLPAAEQKFMDRLTAVVMHQIDNADFTVEALAEGVNMSRVQLHRKLKALTSTTATNFIRNIRMKKAADLLSAGNQSVTQVAYAVGFDNLSYFAKLFQEQYGVLPSQYGKAHTNSDE